jgi:hypothetical protein
VHLPGGHYAPFLDGHQQAAGAELSFLRTHLLGQPRPDDQATASAGHPGRLA